MPAVVLDVEADAGGAQPEQDGQGHALDPGPGPEHEQRIQPAKSRGGSPSSRTSASSRAAAGPSWRSTPRPAAEYPLEGRIAAKVSVRVGDPVPVGLGREQTGATSTSRILGSTNLAERASRRRTARLGHAGEGRSARRCHAHRSEAARPRRPIGPAFVAAAAALWSDAPRPFVFAARFTTGALPGARSAPGRGAPVIEQESEPRHDARVVVQNGDVLVTRVFHGQSQGLSPEIPLRGHEDTPARPWLRGWLPM